MSETQHTVIKERPILFNDDMIKAILIGQKTETRRPVKAAFPLDKAEFKCLHHHEAAKLGIQAYFHLDDIEFAGTKFPYGKVGEHLWVKEAFYKYYPGKNWPAPSAIYRADCGKGTHVEEDGKKQPWVLSRFMPRWASRITLEITDVYVEQVQDITEHGALAEGVQPADYFGSGMFRDYSRSDIHLSCPRQSFMTLWNALNAKRGLGWAVNPWVWVIKFAIVEITH